VEGPAKAGAPRSKTVEIMWLVVRGKDPARARVPGRHPGLPSGVPGCRLGPVRLDAELERVGRVRVVILEQLAQVGLDPFDGTPVSCAP
jgi:hypothetical protein